MNDWTEAERIIAENAVKRHRSLLSTIVTQVERGELTVYSARQDSDLTEGKGPVVSRGFLLTRELAEAAKELLNGVMGTPNTNDVVGHKIYFDLDDWKKDFQSHLRR